jgi:3-oxoacyl-[acyl-carrier protein] reductase
MILKDKTALVTGGSRGIGRGIVEAFLKQGARVWAFSRSQPQDWNQVESLAQQHGTQVTFLAVDVADEAGLATAVEKVLEQSGGLDILVNNAGITKDNFIFRISNEDWESVLRTNLTSAFYLCRLVIRHMMNRRTGSIINMSSIVGLHGIPLKRMGTAEDIAGSTVFLASDLSAYVTGQVIVVDGGMST